MIHCVECGAQLAGRPLHDAKAVGFECQNGHSFYAFVTSQGVIPTADTVSMARSADDTATLKYWLFDPEARARVPDQLAAVLRRILEWRLTGRQVGKPADRPSFCPFCGAALHRYPTRDVYMEEFRCRNGHEVFTRGSYLVCRDESGDRRELYAEVDDAWLLSLARFYANPDKLVAPYVHPQLRALLLRFLNAAEG